MIVEGICFRDGSLSALPVKDLEPALKAPDALVWIDIENPSAEDLEFLEKRLRFHRLALRACASFDHRPHAVEFEDQFFMVSQVVEFKSRRHYSFKTEHLNIFLGKNYLVTAHKKPNERLSGIFDSVKKNAAAFSRGPDFLLYSLSEQIIDGYFPLLDVLSDSIDSLEDRIFKNPSEQTVNAIFQLKRVTINFKKIVLPQRENMLTLMRANSPFVKEENSIYFRDLYEHVIRINEMIDTYRELTVGALDAYLSTVSNRMNEVMKTLTIIATIILPLTFITGIYGMNFLHMPEIEWQYGYPSVLLLMLLITAVMVLWFKKRKWL